MNKYVVFNLSTQRIISEEFDSQEAALKHIDYINSFHTTTQPKFSLGVLLVGSSTYKEVTGL